MYPFKEGCFAPRNGWYVAAFCNEIGQSLLSRWILNEPIVMFRKADGAAVALQGRCPHRHFPLGESRRIGDTIQCGYHGMTFGADGKCTFIPSQVKVPGVYSVHAYPLVERGLWAWIWPGDPALADEALLPTLEEIGYSSDPAFYARPFYSQQVGGRYQLLNDNLLDLTHLGYLHSGSIGTNDDAATPEERDMNDRRLSSRRYMRNTPATPLITQRFGIEGNVDRISGMDFFFPGFHAGLGDTTFTEGHPRAGETIAASRVWHAVTPGTRYTTNYFFAMGSEDRNGVEAMVELLKPVIAEDVFATEQIEKIVTTLDEVPQELLLRSDQTAVMGRRRLQAMMDAEGQGPRPS
jgi:phenylpropionate dioxygenase-like ring-hydroxylating dioxygenase large terminal subunit